MLVDQTFTFTGWNLDDHRRHCLVAAVQPGVFVFIVGIAFQLEGRQPIVAFVGSVDVHRRDCVFAVIVVTGKCLGVCLVHIFGRQLHRFLRVVAVVVTLVGVHLHRSERLLIGLHAFIKLIRVAVLLCRCVGFIQRHRRQRLLLGAGIHFNRGERFLVVVGRRQRVGRLGCV